jgi:hypothetical protein
MARRGDHGERVVHVVRAEAGQRHGPFALQQERRAERVEAHIGREPVGGSRDARELHLGLRDLEHRPARRVVAVEDAEPFFGQAHRQTRFLARHAIDRSESFEVSRRDARDDAYVGPRDVAEPRDLAGCARADLDDGRARLRLDPEQRQRHADLVVERARRPHGGHRVREHGAEPLLGRRLAARSRDADDLRAVAAPVFRGEVQQGLRRVRDADDERARRADEISAHEILPRSECTSGGGASTSRPAAPRRTASRRNACPSCCASTQRHEDAAGAIAARVGRHRGSDAAALHDLAAGRARDGRGGQPRTTRRAAAAQGCVFLDLWLGAFAHRCNHPASLAARARAATRRSSKGTTLSLNIW